MTHTHPPSPSPDPRRTATPTPSRLAPARRRARVVKTAAAGAAAVGFGLLSVAVRGGDAGSAGSPSASTGGLDLSSRISQAAEESQSFFGSGSVSPSSSDTPQASTHTS